MIETIGGLPVGCVGLRAEGKVELFLGGPAANTPWSAVTIGHDIYVRSSDELKAIEGWN